MNYIDYFHHALFRPNTYHRRFDLDLPKMQETVKRVALASLPFVSLYRPAGSVLSIGMHGLRSFSHLQSAIQAEGEKKWGGFAVETGQAALAVLSLATAVYHSTSALFITTGCDAFQGMASCGGSLWKGEYAKAFEEALQMLASAAYLSFMATGSLEMMVVFGVIHGALSLYQAQGELAEGRYLEGCAKLGLAAVRFNQAHQYAIQIQRRNALLDILRIRAVFEKSLRGREASHLIHHPLSSLKERIEAGEVILRNGTGEEIDFGAHFHGNGGALVKGENLAFRTRVVDGKEVTELDFKVNHAFRGAIDEALKQLKAIKPKEMGEILTLSGSHAEKLVIDQGSLLRGTGGFFAPGSAYRIKMEGLGEILIGREAAEPNLYDRVVVRLDSNRTLYELHELLSFVDLHQALSLSTKEDIERLKMGHLYRTFFPREATPLERTKEFFDLPLDQLKAKMIEKSPDMKGVFETYFPKMKEEHLLNGRVRYRIDGLAEAAYQEGARALTAAITGSYSEKEQFERLASMLQMGMICTEWRDANGIGQHGLGGFGADYMSGGADSVFTQLLTEKNCREKMSFNQLHYQSKVRLLLSLEALEMGTYQYHSDSFGNRIYDSQSPWWRFQEKYGERDGILEYIRKEQAAQWTDGGHEVMFKERIDPSYFKGVVVADQKTKSDLIAYLEGAGLIENGKILNQTVDRFVRVGTSVTEDLIG